MIGLVHEGLTRARPDVPPEIVREIGAQAATLVRENLAMARESLRLQRLFDDADLPVLFVKGAALAMLAFGNLGLRAGQDIDLLVPYGDAAGGNGAHLATRAIAASIPRQTLVMRSCGW